MLKLDIGNLKNKRTLRFLLIFPVALVWDITYGAVTLIYDLMTKVNDIGEKWLENFVEGE